MATTIKMCDMPISISLSVFEMLNHGKVTIQRPGTGMCTQYFVLTDCEPKDLVYPEGWYYAKGCFRNKHMSTTGMYQEARMRTTSGEFWSKKAGYCTLDDD